MKITLSGFALYRSGLLVRVYLPLSVMWLGETGLELFTVGRGETQEGGVGEEQDPPPRARTPAQPLHGDAQRAHSVDTAPSKLWPEWPCVSKACLPRHEVTWG